MGSFHTFVPSFREYVLEAHLVNSKCHATFQVFVSALMSVLAREIGCASVDLV